MSSRCSRFYLLDWLVSGLRRLPTSLGTRRSPRGTDWPHAIAYSEPDETLIRVVWKTWQLEDAILRDRVLHRIRQLIPGFLPTVPGALVLDVYRTVGVREAGRRSPDLTQGPDDSRGQIVEVLTPSLGRDHEDRHVQNYCERKQVMALRLISCKRCPEILVERLAVALPLRRTGEFQRERRGKRHAPRLEDEPVQKAVAPPP
jgi:hypothetical protein